jgi:paraquat-inducible protein A
MIVFPHLIACEHCDSLFVRRALEPHEVARCSRCDAVLGRHSGLGLEGMGALVVSAVLLFGLASAVPLFTVDVRGVARDITLWDPIVALASGPAWPLAPAAALFFLGVPLAQVAVLAWLFAWAARRERAPGFAACLRVLHALRPWSMLEVCLLGALVAVIKLAGMAQVAPGIGLAALAALSILLLILGNRDINGLWEATADVRLSSLDDRDPWLGHHVSSGATPFRAEDDDDAAAPRVAGELPASSVLRAADLGLVSCHDCALVTRPAARSDAPAFPRRDASRSSRGDASEPGSPVHARPTPCPRCAAPLHARTLHANLRAWSFLFAALACYVPANLLPVLTTRWVGQDTDSTILGGVLEFVSVGDWDIALLIFVASVVVPCTKFFVLAMLLLGRGRPTPSGRLARARLYRLLELIGYWSMLDVIVVGLVSAAVQFDVIAMAQAREGILWFGASVVLTMLATASFDPRALWDAHSTAQDRAPGTPLAVEPSPR